MIVQVRSSMTCERRSMTTSTRPPRSAQSTTPRTPATTSPRPPRYWVLTCNERKAGMSDIQVQLPDGSRRSLPAGSSALDLAAAIGKRLAKDALAAEVNGELKDLVEPLPEDAVVSIVTPAS